jgi:ribosome-associated translation inhibitor RaiA
MQSSINITFRHLDHSGAVADRARKLGSRLQRFNERILESRMTIERSGNPSDGAAPYLVKIDLTVPGAHIHADSRGIDGAGHKDIYLALRDAFNNAKRQLLDLHRDQSGSARSLRPQS